jgi:hypothetical protein
MRHGLAWLLLAVGTFVSAAPPLPAVPKARPGTQCVEDPADMRRHHMDYLKHQRDATVHGGIRGAKHSLKDCVACHATTATGSVAAATGDFCVACHQYAAVKIDCFECHTGKPGGKPATAVAKGTP